MKDKLNNLIQEIVNFSCVLNFTDNPDNSNFQNACQLFSSYLDNHFAEIKAGLKITGCKDDMNWTTDETTKLGHLISSHKDLDKPYSLWIQDLSQYCKALQREKTKAA